MSVEFCGLELAHPIINGSGTFDALAARRAFGAALDEQFPFAAYVSKTITLEPRAGNPPPRLWETPAGLINSIGLPNKGLAGYLAEDLPELASLPVPLITNVMGSSAAEIAELVQACDARAEIAAIELNVSCPNVKTGLDIGADPRQLEQVVRAVRARTGKPLIVKLTPNAADVAACAVAAQEGGADAVSLINTLRALALAPASRGGRDAVARAARAVAGGRHGRSVGARDPRRRARPGGGRGRARGDPRDRDGRGQQRDACTRAARCRRAARGGRDGELPRPHAGARIARNWIPAGPSSRLSLRAPRRSDAPARVGDGWSCGCGWLIGQNRA